MAAVEWSGGVTHLVPHVDLGRLADEVYSVEIIEALAEGARGEFLLFLSQDTVPCGDDFIATLVAAFCEGSRVRLWPWPRLPDDDEVEPGTPGKCRLDPVSGKTTCFCHHIAFGPSRPKEDTPMT